jgi:tripartite-type tricarboxylate transporter receptor subunit TctC
MFRQWAIFCRASKQASGGGVGAPKNTPVEVIDKLNKEINVVLSAPEMKARLTDLGSMVLAGSSADFGSLIAQDIEKWAKVVKFAGIKAD